MCTYVRVVIDNQVVENVFTVRWLNRRKGGLAACGWFDRWNAGFAACDRLDQWKEASRPATGLAGATSASAKTTEPTASYGSGIPKAAPGIYAIAKFNGKNYGPWSSRIETLLKIQGAWGLVDGDELEPFGGDGGQWEMRNANALATLGSTMEDSVFRTIHNVENATEAWRELKTIYQPPGS
ncbi:MAG: hypothetical protein M1826_005882 [Phylliscum demangeonii]|nr:MAG: hypothetical protein M1826_005882 [Phylliscum demangeonii]